MTSTDIISYRLWNQQLTQTTFKKPHQLVAWMGAMQAQEYAMAKWSVGVRLPHLSESDVEYAFNKGLILRTHVLRPTWHFVSPQDIRWMLTLTAPRVYATSAFMMKKMELNEKIFRKSEAIIAKALTGKKNLTRQALRAALEEGKIVTDEFRLTYLLMRAELEAIICSGPREGKQFTYSLLEERVAPARSISREEALSKLSMLYFDSRGPATIYDFATWSGLTIADAKKGADVLPSRFVKESFDGKEFIYPHRSHYRNATDKKTFLMPDFDEYGIGYKDRSVIFSHEKFADSVSRGNPVFNRMVIIDGKIEGTWKRTIKGKKIIVETFLFNSLNQRKRSLLKSAEKAFLSFTSEA